MARCDISVRGAGIFGLSVAWACVEAGATVELVDPGGVAAGASGGVVGALAPHVPENWNAKKQFQLESLLMAGAFWRRAMRITAAPRCRYRLAVGTRFGFDVGSATLAAVGGD